MNEIVSDPIGDLHRTPDRPALGVYRTVLAFFIVLGACWVSWASYSRRSDTCAVCRMDRVDHAFLDWKWADQQETECSQWYRDNVEPAHDHFWVRGAKCDPGGIPGFPWAVGYGGVNPITRLSQSMQMEVYRHFDDRLEAKQLFLCGGRWDDDAGVDRFLKLSDWADRGFPGTWQEWLRNDGDKLAEADPN